MSQLYLLTMILKHVDALKKLLVGTVLCMDDTTLPFHTVLKNVDLDIIDLGVELWTQIP